MTGSVDVIQHSVKASRPTDAQMDRHVCILAQAGALRLEAEGLRWSLVPGHVALAAAGMQVRVSVPSRVTATWVHIDRELAPDLASGLSVFGATGLVREMIGALGDDADVALGPEVRARLARSLVDVAAVLATEPSRCVLPVAKSEALARAVALAEAELENLPSFGEIARETGQSTRSLTRHCAEEMGMSWRDLIRRVRMIRAVEALSTTDAPVAEVAVLVGYTALSGFNDAFRDVMRQSPTEFRAMARAG